MSRTNNMVFKSLKIVSWVIFVGLCIEAGGLLVNFFFSLYNPEFIPKLYQNLNLSDMHESNAWAFYSMYSFILSISIMKALLFYQVILLVSKINLSKPFNKFVSKKISIISYFALLIGFFSILARHTSNNLKHQGYNIDRLNQFWTDGQAFILMAAVIYIIAAIFSKGVALQTENELTV